jgi:hypothetical protein
MRDRVWLSVDLSAGQDFRGLHRWLVRQEARECAGGLYTFFFEHRDNLEAELRFELERHVSLAEGDRVYLIYKDAADGEVTGVFLAGERRPAPWERNH